MTTRETVYVGLGSNLDGPRLQVSRALQELGELPQTRLVAASPLYCSAPLGPADQPDYINAVACLHTGLAPLALLDALQLLEKNHRRIRDRHWGPRTLDLDILLYGGQTIATGRLQVPHPHMHRRSFVLKPLLDIAPDLVIPGKGVAVDWLANSDGLQLKRLSL